MARRRNKNRKQGRKHRGPDGPTQAELADRHALYEEAVQTPDVEAEFIATTFASMRDRTPRRLREDFAGTMALACEWVKAGDDREAVAVDLDPEVLTWGREKHVAALDGSQRARLEIHQADVREHGSSDLDVICAFNFSYWYFKTRAELGAYFRHARSQLAEDGVMFLDCFGGYEAQREMEEDREQDDFDYIWDQASFDPISHDYTCHIHFLFPDGSRMDRAFTYHWRLWSLPEIRELLQEAGFARSTVWWQGWDEDGEEGDFEPQVRGEADAGWVCYIVAER